MLSKRMVLQGKWVVSNREKLATVRCQLFQEYGGHEKFDCSLIVAQACDEQINHILQPSTLECGARLVWCTDFDMGTAPHQK